MPKISEVTVIEHARPGFDLMIATDDSNVTEIAWFPHKDCEPVVTKETP